MYFFNDKFTCFEIIYNFTTNILNRNTFLKIKSYIKLN